MFDFETKIRKTCEDFNLKFLGCNTRTDINYLYQETLGDDETEIFPVSRHRSLEFSLCGLGDHNTADFVSVINEHFPTYKLDSADWRKRGNMTTFYYEEYEDGVV